MKKFDFWSYFGPKNGGWDQHIQIILTRIKNDIDLNGEDFVNDYYIWCKRRLYEINNIHTLCAVYLLYEGVLGDDEYFRFLNEIIFLGREIYQEIADNSERILKFPELCEECVDSEISIFYPIPPDKYRVFQSRRVVREKVPSISDVTEDLAQKLCPKLYDRYAETTDWH